MTSSANGWLSKTWTWAQYIDSLEWFMPPWARFGMESYLRWVEWHETRLQWLRWTAIGLLSALVFLGEEVCDGPVQITEGTRWRNV